MALDELMSAPDPDCVKTLAGLPRVMRCWAWIVLPRAFSVWRFWVVDWSFCRDLTVLSGDLG